VKPETSRAKIIDRLTAEGWTLTRHGGDHDIWEHPDVMAPAIVPRHRELSVGVARQIARIAGWK